MTNPHFAEVQPTAEAFHEHPDLPVLLAQETKLLFDKHPEKIFELIEGVGSPLHFIFPQRLEQNIREFKQVLKKHNQQAKIFYAKKANKSQQVALVCASHGVGIDVASSQEFELALAAGIAGPQISVSGPEKSLPLLRLAINQGAQVALDSLEELHKFVSLIRSHAIAGDAGCDLHQTTGHLPRVLLRFRPDSDSHSRFGIGQERLEVALSVLQQHLGDVDLVGFSFHLSGYDIGARAQAMSQLCHWLDVARSRGFTRCNQINIGGGLPMRYVDESSWSAFVNRLESQHFHRNHNFPGGFYPYGNSVSGSEALDTLLSCRCATGVSFGKYFAENEIVLALEPGRSLLDQVGVTAFSIQGMKYLEHPANYRVATVSGMSFSLSEQWFGSEYLPSPILLKQGPIIGVQPGEPGAVFPTAVAGSSCLECDMVSWRKIPFKTLPEVNDVLVYPNTAGYQMDSNESAFHCATILPKVAVWLDGDQLRWQLDA